MGWLTETALRRRAGARIFERGSLCVANVSGLAEEAGTVTASVTSSARSEVSYRVRLHERDGETAEDCDCPYGLEGHFCKHCVATGLKLIGGSWTQQTSPSPELPRHQEQWQAIEAFLAGRQPHELAELLRDAAHNDPALCHRLWLLATTRDPAQLQKQAEQLRKRYGAGEGAAYAEQSRAIVFALSHQPAAYHADAQEGLQLVLCRLLDAVDRDREYDRPGEATAYDDDAPVQEVISVAWREYVRLCRITPPDAVQLAQWFVGVRLGHPQYRYCFPASDLAPFGGVLAACRKALATAEGAPAQKQALQEEVLEAADDTDGHVALLAADLSTYRAYARIAEVLVAASRTEDAIGWLERARNPGVKLGDDPRPVAELLATLYTRQGRWVDALQVRRRHFASARTEAAYRALREAAGKAGVDWPPLRDEALGLLRRAAGPGLPPDTQGGWVMTTGPYARAAQTLVHLLIEEGAPGEAWDVARRHRCQGSTLVKAAHARAVSHPADAIDVYWSLVDQALEFHGRDRNRNYERVANLLFILRDLITRSGGDFRKELAEFRATHSRKRNLMEELTRRGL